MQDFWKIYNHLVRPNDLPNTMDYHLFKTGIKPMWEDPANRRGGKWMVRLRKGIASRYWEDLVRRQEIWTELAAVKDFLTGSVVLD